MTDVLNVITDEFLDPYFIVAEKGQVTVFKKKTRSKKDGTTEIVKGKIIVASNIETALKKVVEDIFATSKSKRILTVGEYIKEYVLALNRLKLHFKIDKNLYI